MRRITFSIFFFLISSVCLAQTYPNVELQRLKSTPWTGRAGIISNNITCVKQASDKFIWLTSYSGIIKFDGYKTEVYDKSNLDILTANGFSNVIEAPDSTLYFASQVDGLLKYKNGEFSLLKPSFGNVPNYVSSVVSGINNELWISSNTAGLYKYQNDSIFKVYENRLKNVNIHYLHLGKNGSLYVCTEGDGLFVIKPNGELINYSEEEGLTNNVVYQIAEKDGIFFLATQNGIFQLENEQITPINYVIHEGINFIKVDGNTLWLGSDNGLGRYNLETEKFEYITGYTNTDLSRINWIEFDHENSIWLGTGRDGLIQLRYNGIINYSKKDGLSSSKVNIVRESYNNTFYFGCDDGGIFKLKDEKITKIELENDPSPTGIRDVYEDEDGSLWVASYQGLVIRKNNKEKLFGLEDGLSSLDIRVIFKDSKNRMWLTTRTGGLIRMIDSKVDKVFNLDSGFPTDFVLSIEEDSNNNLLLGTHSGGLVILKPDDTFEVLSPTGNNLGLVIFNTHVDSKNQLWVISNIGVFLYIQNEFRLVSYDNAPSNLTYFDLLEDDKGGIWITSTQGIINISKNELEKFAADKDYKIRYVIINESDGMASSECTAAVRSIKDSKGNFFIPTINGVAYVNPFEIKRNNQVPEVYITSLKADDKIYRGDDITIPAGKTRYVIDFTALSFIAPDQVTFKYQLKGIDPEPVFLQDLRRVEYTRLPPGKYTFEVIGSNNDRLWNNSTKILEFEVEAFFYQTTWFYILLTILLMMLLYVIYLWRVSGIQKMNVKLRKVNSELDSFVYSASHDLRSPLASILGLIMLARKDQENIESYLDKIQLSIEKLDEFIGEIIEFSSNERKEIIKENISFGELVNKVIADLYYLNESGKIKIILEISDKENFISDKRRIEVVLRNLISNALKYADSTKGQPYVNISITTDASEAIIKVTDNGIGIKSEDVKRVSKMFYRATETSTGSGLGLYIVNEIVEKLKGHLEIQSEYAKGSTFSIKLPTLADKKK